MSNLQIQQKSNLLLNPNVIEEVKTDVFNTVKASIAQCYAHLNLTVPEAKDLTYLINEVTDTIIQNYPSLRLQEIPIAFSNGIRKKYGEYFGLCVVSFEQFITGYLNSPERAELVKETSKIIEVKTEPTDEDKFKTGKALCVELFEKYKKSGQLGLSTIAVYEFLNGIGLIEKSYKEGVYKLALDQTVIDKQKEVALSTDLHKRRALNAEIEMLTENISNDGITEAQHKEVLRTGKRIILKNWFDDLIINEEQLSGLINQA